MVLARLTLVLRNTGCLRLGSSGELEDVSIRDIKPDECLVDIVASGTCHTDLGIASRPESIFPRVLGHESR